MRKSLFVNVLFLTGACLIFFVKYSFAQQSFSPLQITHVSGDFYVYVTYNMYQGQRIPANGLYVVTGKGTVLIDTPWDTTQFQPLLDSIRIRHHQPVVMCISTHFHEDRTGGLQYYKQHGIKTYTTQKTDELSKIKGMKRAEFLIKNDTSFTLGEHSFQTYFPGKGHAPDNIVIWFEKERILYGGCLVKSVSDATLGNLSDASVQDYAATVRNVQEKFGQPKYIITGHNDWTDKQSLAHTLEMAEKAKQKIN